MAGNSEQEASTLKRCPECDSLPNSKYAPAPGVVKLVCSNCTNVWRIDDEK